MKVYLLLFFWALLAIMPPPTLSVLQYRLVPTVNQELCLTMTGGDGNDATFSMRACDPDDNYQRFTRTHGTDYLTKLSALNTPDCCNQCLDVVGGTGNQVRVTQTECDPGVRTQNWVKTSPPGVAPPSIWFKNFVTGRCLTREDNGDYVDQYDCTSGATHQLWTVDPGLHPTIRNGAGGCLQITDNSPYSGAGTNSKACLIGELVYNQHFRIRTSESTNMPSIWKVVGSGKCLDGGSSGGPAYQWDCFPGSQNQQWVPSNYNIEEVIFSAYQVDLLSGLCLTYDPTQSNNVHMEACVQGNSNQLWSTLYIDNA